MKYKIDEYDFFDRTVVEAGNMRDMYLLSVPIGIGCKLLIYSLSALSDCLFTEKGRSALSGADRRFIIMFCGAEAVFIGILMFFLVRAYMRKYRSVTFKTRALIISGLIFLVSTGVIGTLVQMHINNFMWKLFRTSRGLT